MPADPLPTEVREPIGSSMPPGSTCPTAPRIPGSVGPPPHSRGVACVEPHTARWAVPPEDDDTRRPRPSYVLVSDVEPFVNEVRFPAASHTKSWLRVPSRVNALVRLPLWS